MVLTKATLNAISTKCKDEHCQLLGFPAPPRKAAGCGFRAVALRRAGLMTARATSDRGQRVYSWRTPAIRIGRAGAGRGLPVRAGGIRACPASTQSWHAASVCFVVRDANGQALAYYCELSQMACGGRAARR